MQKVILVNGGATRARREGCASLRIIEVAEDPFVTAVELRASVDELMDERAP